MAPIGVDAQSCERISSPISPPWDKSSYPFIAEEEELKVDPISEVLVGEDNYFFHIAIVLKQ